MEKMSMTARGSAQRSWLASLSMTKAAGATIFLTSAAFAIWISYMTAQSLDWYKVQTALVLARTDDAVASALILAVYTGFMKKQLALSIAGMLALLGLGLSLRALRTASTASAEAASTRISLSSVSPGVCAFLAAAVIVVVVVTTRDSFGAPPISELHESPASANTK